MRLGPSTVEGVWEHRFASCRDQSSDELKKTGGEDKGEEGGVDETAAATAVQRVGNVWQKGWHTASSKHRAGGGEASQTALGLEETLQNHYQRRHSEGGSIDEI